MKRKHISWKKKYASALLALGHIPYAHAREMTADQMISLYHVDHNILHETENENVDQWWNLTPRLISEHRIKTKTDAKVIAKSRRIRAKNAPLVEWTVSPDAQAYWMGPGGLYEYIGGKPKRVSKIRSRGFDKTLRKKMDGTVVKRT